jgi:hypothetical protein
MAVIRLIKKKACTERNQKAVNKIENQMEKLVLKATFKNLTKTQDNSLAKKAIKIATKKC